MKSVPCFFMDVSKSQLNISHLKMICVLEQFDTVKEAAQALFITQPALTNRIREAERRLNTKLFIRRGRKIVMSSAGKRLVISAKKILEELARAEHDINRLTDGVERVIRVGLPHYASFSWLPNVVRAFKEEMPEVEIEISAESAIKPLNALYNGDIDVAMIATSQPQLVLDENLYQVEFLLRDELLACVSNTHSFADKDYLEADDFADETYVTNSTIPETDREYELFFKPNNIIPSKVLQVGFNEAIMELIEAGMGVSIFSQRQLNKLVENRKVKTVRLGKAGLAIYWHVVSMKQETVAKATALLSSTIRVQLK